MYAYDISSVSQLRRLVEEKKGRKEHLTLNFCGSIEKLNLIDQKECASLLSELERFTAVTYTKRLKSLSKILMHVKETEITLDIDLTPGNSESLRSLNGLIKLSHKTNLQISQLTSGIAFVIIEATKDKESKSKLKLALTDIVVSNLDFMACLSSEIIKSSTFSLNQRTSKLLVLTHLTEVVLKANYGDSCIFTALKSMPTFCRCRFDSVGVENIKVKLISAFDRNLLKRIDFELQASVGYFYELVDLQCFKKVIGYRDIFNVIFLCENVYIFGNWKAKPYELRKVHLKDPIIYLRSIREVYNL